VQITTSQTNAYGGTVHTLFFLPQHNIVFLNTVLQMQMQMQIHTVQCLHST